MNLNVRSQNSYFPLTSLPVDVIYHIAQYLTRCDIRNMVKVDRYLREVFSSPHLWKDVRVCLPEKGIDPQSVEILRMREIRDLEVYSLNFELQTLALQPYVERLSLRVTTVKTLKALTKAASSGQLKLKSLAFGCIRYTVGQQSKVTFLDLFKCLPMLEEVCIGHFGSFLSYTDQKYVLDVPLTNETENPVVVDLQQALCCTGKLLDISLKWFSNVGRSWLKTVVLKNPNLQTLCLAGIQNFTLEGLDDAADPSVCSDLTTFKLLIQRTFSSSPQYQRPAKQILSWAFPGNDTYENLTSLDLTGCHTSTIIKLCPTFPGLKKLNLTDSNLLPNPVHVRHLGSYRYYLEEIWVHFPNLEWLELKGCHMPCELNFVFARAGRTLGYLGLAEHHLLSDYNLWDLPLLFPVLETLDLSGCKQITDWTLEEWYINRPQQDACWPKSLRKLVMKGCEGVSQEMVDRVRMKTGDQLLIEL